MSASRASASGSRNKSLPSQANGVAAAASNGRRSRSSATRQRGNDDEGSGLDGDADGENDPAAARQRKRLRQIKHEAMDGAAASTRGPMGDSQTQPEAEASTSTARTSSLTPPLSMPTASDAGSTALAEMKREEQMLNSHSQAGPSQATDGEDEEIEAGPSSGRQIQPETAAAAFQSDENAIERDADGFIPGSIVRVKLENFLTYDSVEFAPGPHLNMIIGPNGTGKSAIVCAIALGLGWKPATLGRAKDVAAFVKQGQEEGFTEIELKGPIGERNTVIRRIIHRKNNQNEYRLNGKKATSNEIKEAVQHFDIDVGNLCCFLPQDKVAEFARMDPSRLLIETEKAAGDGNLEHWHEKLVGYGAEVRDLEGKLQEERDEQQNLEQRNEVLSRDVDRFEEKRRLEDEVALLEVRLPFAEYTRARTAYSKARDAKIERKADLNALRQANQPLERKVDDMKEEQRKLESRKQRWEEKVKKLDREIMKHVKTVDELDTDMTDLYGSMENMKSREKMHQSLIAKLKQEIATLEAIIGQQPQQADTSDVDQALRQTRASMRQIEERQRAIQERIEDIGIENHSLHSTKDETLRKLQRLDDARGRKIQMLRTADAHAVKAIEWLRANQNLFQQKVYEPVMLEVSVKDSRATAHVESCINWQQMRTFVCQTRADYDLFTRELVDKHKLKLNVSELEGARSTRQMEAQRPFQIDDIRRMGFDDFVCNLVEAPEPVMQFLYSSCNVHTIPVAFGDTVNLEQAESTKQLRRYIANGANHTIQYSEYGNRLPQTMSRDLNAPRTLTQTANQAEKKRLEQVMKDVAEKLSETESKVGELQGDLAREKEAMAEEKAKKEDLERQRQDALRALHEWERAKVDADQKRKRLDMELRKPSAQQERQRIAKQLESKTLKRLEAVSTLHGIVVDQVQLRAEVDVALLAELQHASNYSAWKSYLHTKDNDFIEAENRYKDASLALEQAKKACDKHRESAQARLDLLPQEVKDRFEEEQQQEADRNEPAMDIGQIQSQLFEKRAALELAQGVSPAVVEAYKKRAAQIKSLDESIIIKERDLVKKMTKLEKIREKWYPELDRLVKQVSEKFSAAFDRIGCAGEVRLSEADDHHYEKWGIDILVKFRDSENLQLLTGQRQSGGERSLSTILYLMSLTELYRCPFSLVDEINQGMDQRAERAVHDQMVEVTCRSSAGQYFLITPKLLTELRYHERMKVLIINNGEWMPEKLSLARYAKLATGGMAGGAATASGSSGRAIVV